MSLPINSALYYPTIEFYDYRWLWTASLVWDKIYRIEPDGFTPNEPDNIRRLCEEGDIGIPLRPAKYANEVAKEFVSLLESNHWNAAAFESDSLQGEYASIHHEKIDVKIRELLISKGCALVENEWLNVPTDFEALYMTYLAKKMAEKNNLHPVTDADAAWTALTYYNTDDIEIECDPNQAPFALAALMIGDYLPANITNITPKEILKFRNQYPDERRNFMRAINTAAAQLANCEDVTVFKEILKTIQDDVDRATKDFKRALRVFRTESFTGIKALSLPVSTNILAQLFPLQFTESVSLGVAGLGLGLIAGIDSYKHGAKNLSKAHEFSYLVHANKSFSKASDRIDTTNFMYSDLKEFIAD